MHDGIILSTVESDLQRRVRMSRPLPQQPWHCLALLKQPHLDGVAFLGCRNKYGLTRHELDEADLFATMWLLQGGTDHSLVQIPEHNILTTLSALSNAGQETHIHLGIARKGERLDWTSVLALIE